MIPRAGVFIDTVFDPDRSFPFRQILRNNRAKFSLPLELALALGDDHLEPLVVRGHRVLQHPGHVADAVVVHRLHPADADALERALDRHVAGLEFAVLRAGGQLLRAGGGAVAVLHDDEDAVVLVEHGVGDAGGQAVVPEAAVAHDAHGALAEHGVHGGVGGEPQAVAEHRVADVERRQRGKQVAADVGRDVHRTRIALGHLHRREHRSLRAADAEPGRARRDDAEQRCCFFLEGSHRLNFFFKIQKPRNSGQNHFARVLPGHRQQSLAQDLHVVGAGPAQRGLDRIFYVGGLAFLDHQDTFLARAEIDDLFRDHRVGDVHAVDRHPRGAEGVGKAQ